MITWTEEQDYIIRYDRPANLLVSAAGSARRLSNGTYRSARTVKIRLPHILVMTFTNWQPTNETAHRGALSRSQKEDRTHCGTSARSNLDRARFL